MDKILDLAREVTALNPFLWKFIDHQLAMHVINWFPIDLEGQGMSCKLCNWGQPPQISFLYKEAGTYSDTTLLISTDLDDWN